MICRLTVMAGFILICFAAMNCSGPKVMIAESLEDLQQAVDNDPNNHVVHYNLGIKYLSGNQYDEALEAFNRCLTIRSNFALAHFAIYCTQLVRDSDLYEESLKETPSEEYSDQIEELKRHLNAAFVHDPFFDWRLGTLLLDAKPTIFDPHLSHLYDLLFEGFRDFSLGQNERAVKRLTKTIKAFPEYSQARLVRGLAYAQVQDYDAAIADFQSLVEEMEKYNQSKILPVYLNPAEIYYLIGYAHLKKNDLNEAEFAFQKVIENKIDFYMAHFQLSNIYH